VALSYVVFFAILLVALGLVFRQTLEATFESQMAQTLEEEWGAVKGYLRIDKAGIDWFYDRYDPEEAFIVERLRRVYLLADSEGNPLEYSPTYKSIGFESRDQIKAQIASGGRSVQVRKDNQGTPYVIRRGVVVGESHHRYFLAIGRSMADNRKVLQQFTWNYFIVAPIVILVSALFGWFMAGRALEPVNSVAETAQRITHSNLDMQIPLRHAGDELDRLIEAFNRMMARLSSSFEQVRRFSTDVSHELRTPLTVIRGQLEVALFTAKTAEQYRDAMVNALEDVERLSNIVRALLMLSQAETGQLVLQKSDIDLSDLVRDLVDQFQIPAEAEGVSLTAELPEICLIRADRTQIERLITNLLSNAIKYTPTPGEVLVSLAEDGDRAKLSVRDSGVGIAQDHLPHIFDRFYRVPSADPEKGLGLGLSFVAWIVRAHGGTIEVASEPGKGATFTVWLPVGPVQTAAPQTAAIAASEQLN